MDSICINQQDFAERGQQVAMMGDIYRQSNRNLVYLGEGDESTEVAFESIEAVNKVIRPETNGFTKLEGTAPYQNVPPSITARLCDS
jgi:hypothetical protein